MPHIVKFQEKVQYAPRSVLPYTAWLEDYNRLYKPVKNISIYSIIEDIVNDVLPKTTDKFFNQFVEIKEVPYGRDN